MMCFCGHNAINHEKKKIKSHTLKRSLIRWEKVLLQIFEGEQIEEVLWVLIRILPNSSFETFSRYYTESSNFWILIRQKTLILIKLWF